MQLHSLTSLHTGTRGKRIGRGGKRGKTSGRGTKGQKARAGNSTRPEIRDFIKRFPKRRGFGTNRSRTVNAERVRPVAVNLDALAKLPTDVSSVTPKTLAAAGIVARKGGRLPEVKILSRGDVSRKFVVDGCALSGTAREKIEKAGGRVAGSTSH